MKSFIAASIVFLLLIGGVTVNDVYCHTACDQIIKSAEQKNIESAQNALDKFKRNEFLLKCSVDNGYVIEARVSLESLISAYEEKDEYEISRYIRDIQIRVERIQKALFI